MSTFLHPEAFLCAAGITQAAVQTTIDGKLIAQGWQRLTFDTTNFISDFIPPVGETIGDGRWQQVARIYYNTADISFSMYDWPTSNASTLMQRIYAKTGGAVQTIAYASSGTNFAITASCATSVLTVTATAGVLSIGSSIAIGGFIAYIASLGTGTGGNGTYNLDRALGTITSQGGTGQVASFVSGATGTAGSSASDNLYSLYCAMAASVDPNFTQWQITYWPGIGGTDSILLEKKTWTSSYCNVIGNVNVNFTQHAEAVTANIVSAQSIAGALFGKYAVTIDRANGFYVYMGIFSRSFHIGIKTTSSFFGPMFCYWSPNADAITMTPTNDPRFIWPLCHIQEGFFGLVTGTALAPAEIYNVRTTGIFVLGYVWNFSSTSNVNFNLSNPFSSNPWNGSNTPGIMTMFPALAHFSNQSETYAAYGLGLNTYSTNAGTVDVVNVASSPTPYTISNNSNFSLWIQSTAPAAYFEDVFAATSTNTDGNEVTSISGSPTPSGITLQQNLDDTTAYTTILLNTTTGMAASGTNYLVLNQEVFQYTGTSGGNTLTGVTRAFNASPQRKHFIGDIAQQGVWFIKINGGYLYCGPAKPVAS